MEKNLPVTRDNPFIYHPQFFNLNDPGDFQRFTLLKEKKEIQVADTIRDQIKELIKLRNPTKKLTEEEYSLHTEALLSGTPVSAFGVWVYYSWNNCLVHLLAEKEFIEVRTNRNQYKITPEELEILKKKKIGIIGLSVGQSIALTLAIERVCGELRLADFDVLELSNLNRIRAGVHNLGLPKVIIAAREIAEIDPYLQVKIYPEGITETNIDDFFGNGSEQIDLLVEVCDGLDIKIISRFKAQKLKIPVVMDTNDKGMLDVERFDLEPDRPILHGLAGDLDPSKIKSLTNEQKIPYILKMIGADSISPRFKASMIEIEQTITTWPQLASSVQLGGALTTDITRRILLNQFHESGRYYIDLEDLIKDTNLPQKSEDDHAEKPFKALDAEELKQVSRNFDATAHAEKDPVPADTIRKIIEAALIAPSAGNNQPWKWIIKKDMLFLFHDQSRSFSWGDYAAIGAYESLGAAIENASLKALQLGFNANVQLFPDKNIPWFIAAISFNSIFKEDRNPLLEDLAGSIEVRCTNRKNGERQQLDPSFYKGLEQIVTTVEGAQIQVIADDKKLAQLGEIISACDRVRFLYEKGHKEFYEELRWTHAEAEQTGDGLDISLIDLTATDLAGFRMARDWNAVKFIAALDKGRVFQKMSRKSVASASSIVLVTMPHFNNSNFINAGRAVERSWIYANKNGVSVHPMLSPVFFFNRLIHGNGTEIPENLKKELQGLRKDFENIFNLSNNIAEVFLFKLAIANKTEQKTFRLPYENVVAETE